MHKNVNNLQYGNEDEGIELDDKSHSSEQRRPLLQPTSIQATVSKITDK